MSSLGPLLIVAVLYLIGFLPMQRLKSKRSTVISAFLGIAVIPIAIALIRAGSLGQTPLTLLVFLGWLIPVGFSMLFGSITRFIVLGFPTATRNRRWAITAIGGVLFFIAIILVIRMIVGRL